jgi:hypothetical protein
MGDMNARVGCGSKSKTVVNLEKKFKMTMVID